MSLRPAPIDPVPAETALVARAAFPKGNAWLLLRDELGTIFTDETFAPLFPRRGRPAEAPWRLALVTLLQYAENLSDRQAANAVRGRIDWKYLLGLELIDSGFDSSVLSEFRSRLFVGGAEEQLLDTLLQCCRERRLLLPRGRQRTDSTHVLAKVRALNRVELVGQTLGAALNALATAHPEWLRSKAQEVWVERYGRRVDDYHLPKGEAERRTYAIGISRDGHELLDRLTDPAAPPWLRLLPAVEVLRQVWMQQFYRVENEVHWRTAAEGIPPSALFVSSPYDPEARYAKKHTTSWIGYKVHLTETCEDDLPHLITHVETTAGPIADGAVTEPVHQALQTKDLLPRTHIVDTGYLDAELLVNSERDFAVDLLGPTRKDLHWQARNRTGFAARDFRINWEAKKATCPAGKQSIEWMPLVDNRGNDVIKMKFSTIDCAACPHRSQCTRSTRPRRTLTIRPEQQYLALEAARRREAQEDFAMEHARRAGIEGTLSQGVRVMHLRRSRYWGQGKTHLQHVLTAAAIDLRRLAAWLAGEAPEKTRKPAFGRLMSAPAPN